MNDTIYKTFDPNMIVEGDKVLFLASSGSGKSFLIRDICWHLRDLVSCGVVISPTADMAKPGEGYDFFPPAAIYADPEPEILENVMARGSEVHDKIERLKQKGRTMNPITMIILDDCLAEASKWLKTDETRKTMMQGRHYKIITFMVSQGVKDVPTWFRSNLNWVVILGEFNKTEMKKIYEEYASCYKTPKEFYQAYEEITSLKYRCMIIHKSESGDLEEKVFHYKASPRKKRTSSRTPPSLTLSNFQYAINS